MATHRRLLITVLAAALIGGLLSIFTGPHTPQLSTTHGDTALLADVQRTLGHERGYQTLSVTRLRDGKVERASFGSEAAGVPDAQTSYELGSITKTFTGALLADGVRRGELKYDEPVSTHLPELAGTPVGESTLEQLATHTAGLPPYPPSDIPQVYLATIGNRNVYGGSAAQLIDASRTVKITERGSYAYSNLGMSLLGHAEARAAGVADWPTLARDRILVPLGMTRTMFAIDGPAAPATSLGGHLDNGWPAADSFGAAFAPAGSSTWTTTEDLLIYAQALFAGRVPGMEALDQRTEIPGGGIGLAWHLTERNGRMLTWHNGATSGFRTMFALDRERQQAVIILSNSTQNADRAGLALAADNLEPGAGQSKVAWIGLLAWSIVGLALLISFAVGMVRLRDRLAVVTAVLNGLAGLVILLVRGPWLIVPGWLWGALVGAALVWAGWGLLRARGLPALPGRRRAGAGLSLVSAVVLVGVAGWAL